MRARILSIFLLLLLLPTASQADHSTAHGVQVIVLDAGHGGNDPGASYGGVREKDLTLKVVLRLGKKIEQGMPGVKVVYTRKTDKALAPTKIEDLQKRADIANAAGGDLFISVHVNAAKSATAQGVETLIMGESPKEQRYNENALYESNRDDLLDMSDEREAAIIRANIENMQFTYGEYSRMMANCIQQNYMKAGRHSRGVKPQLLRVLYATNMPGVLTEIGFLSNKEEAAYLKSEKGINQLVDALYRAVRTYSESVRKMRLAEEGSPVAAAPAKPATAVAKPAVAPAKPAAKSDKTAEKPVAKPVEPTTQPTPQQPQNPKLFDPRLYNDAKAVIEQETKRSAEPTTKQEPAKPVEQSVAAFHTVQVRATSKPLSLNSSDFKEYRNSIVAYKGEGNYPYKYGIGRYKTRQEAAEAVVILRRKFQGCFVVSVREQQVIPIKK